MCKQVQQQHEEAVKEINQAMAVRIKANKDLKRLTEERNAAMQEYSLVMSERDSVHKEMEKLTEDLTQAYQKNKALELETKDILEEVKKYYCFLYLFTMVNYLFHSDICLFLMGELILHIYFCLQ